MTTLHPRRKLGITRCKSNSHIKLSQLVTINIEMLNTVQELLPAQQGRHSVNILHLWCNFHNQGKTSMNIALPCGLIVLLSRHWEVRSKVLDTLTEY